jgi:hypothetical protein
VKLHLEFGAEAETVAAGVRAASADQVELWRSRVFDADSIDDVFGDLTGTSTHG